MDSINQKPNQDIDFQDNAQWTGMKRLKSDLFWCSCIAMLGIIAQNSQKNNSSFMCDDIGTFLGISVAIFFAAFFWSWKPKYVQDKSIRRVIKILFSIWIAISTITILLNLWILINNFQAQRMLIITIALFIVWNFFVIRKYKKLIHPNTLASN